MELRDYQQKCLASIRDHAARGVTRQLVSLPTGTGKTHVFARLPEGLGLKPEDRMLVLAHREELIDQAVEKLRAANPGRAIGVEMAEASAAPDDSIVVGSVQSLVKRLAKYDPAAFKVIVTDEAHHAPAPTYRTIYEHLGALNGGGVLHCGFTATAKRGDGVGLAGVFSKVVFHRGLLSMIRAGWLAEITGWRVQTNEDISMVRTVAGEFAAAPLARAVNTDARNRLIVDAFVHRCQGRKAIAFCADVAHAKALAAEFQRFGVRAAAVYGSMKAVERRALIDAYRSRDLHLLCNCDLLTEGFDDPSTGAILMCRPTQSALWYTQALGRGPGIAPGKTDLVLLDFVDVTRKHSAVTLPELAGLNPRLDLKGRKVAELVERIGKAGIDGARHSDIRSLEYQLERVDLFRRAPTSVEVRQWSTFSWVRVIDGVYRLALPERQSLTISRNALGRFDLYEESASGHRVVGEYKHLGHAFEKADSSVPREAIGVLKANARWRRKRPTPSQLSTAERLRLPVGRKTTRGEVSAMISAHFGRRSQEARS